MKHAYVTLMCGGDSYLPGVEALGRSLEETNSRIPRLALLTPDVTPSARQQLEKQGWQLRNVDPIGQPGRDPLLFPRFAMSFTKLRVFDLEDVQKVVFLDADTLVLRNVDELFERPALAAAPDFFMPDRFNSGVMVIEPAHDLFEKLIKALAVLPSYDGGDQGVLNSFWSKWWSMPAAHRLGAGYNMHHFVFQFLVAHEGLRRQFLDEIKIVHYTLQKPWLTMTMTGGAALWWKKFYGVHPEEDHGWRRRVHQLEDWSFDSLVNALSR